MSNTAGMKDSGAEGHEAAAGAARVRIGHGYDLHRLAPTDCEGGQQGRPMVIGGVLLVHDLGPVAHSDGDALMHAITDAILGALGLPDIGQLFPDRDPRWKGARSEVFLTEARRLAAQAGWSVGNVDATVIVESPKLGSRKDEIRANLARILGIEVGCVNIKGKTHELAFAAESRIEAHAVALMVRTGD